MCVDFYKKKFTCKSKSPSIIKDIKCFKSNIFGVRKVVKMFDQNYNSFENNQKKNNVKLVIVYFTL